MKQSTSTTPNFENEDKDKVIELDNFVLNIENEISFDEENDDFEKLLREKKRIRVLELKMSKYQQLKINLTQEIKLNKNLDGLKSSESRLRRKIKKMKRKMKVKEQEEKKRNYNRSINEILDENTKSHSSSNESLEEEEEEEEEEKEEKEEYGQENGIFRGICGKEIVKILTPENKKFFSIGNQKYLYKDIQSIQKSNEKCGNLLFQCFSVFKTIFNKDSSNKKRLKLKYVEFRVIMISGTILQFKVESEKSEEFLFCLSRKLSNHK